MQPRAVEAKAQAQGGPAKGEARQRAHQRAGGNNRKPAPQLGQKSRHGAENRRKQAPRNGH